MNSDKKGQIKLSDGWVVCSSKSNPGRKYYFNKRTGKSSWTQPQVNFVIFFNVLCFLDQNWFLLSHKLELCNITL